MTTREINLPILYGPKTMTGAKLADRMDQAMLRSWYHSGPGSGSEPDTEGDFVRFICQGPTQFFSPHYEDWRRDLVLAYVLLMAPRSEIVLARDTGGEPYCPSPETPGCMIQPNWLGSAPAYLGRQSPHTASLVASLAATVDPSFPNTQPLLWPPAQLRYYDQEENALQWPTSVVMLSEVTVRYDALVARLAADVSSLRAKYRGMVRKDPQVERQLDHLEERLG